MKTTKAVFIFITGVLLFISTPVYAAPLLPQVRKVEIEKKQERLQTIGASGGANLAKLKAKAVLLQGTVTAKGSDSLTVSGSDGKTYTVKVDGTTQWRRKFWGKSDLNETSVNDVLNIAGKWIDDGMTQIQARLIRNISIQKRNGVFFGEVKSIGANGWVMTTSKRGDQTVTITGSTRLIDRKELTISQSAIIIGHRVRVRGLWDSKNSTITEVIQVKDFDLPAQTGLPAKPTATPTP